jgi:hypothetical protein
MLRSALMRLAALVVCTILWLVPGIAHAAGAPIFEASDTCDACDACDARTVSVSRQASTPEEAGNACGPGAAEREATLGSDKEDGDGVKVAAMCDARGASMVAPPRVLPVVDARIEAVPGRSLDAPAAAVSPGGHSSHSAGAFVAAADPAILSAIEVISPGCGLLILPELDRTGGPRAGNRPRFERPPR